MQSAPALNGHLPEVAPGPLDAPPRCELALEGPEEGAMGARFMRERLEDRADYIEVRLRSTQILPAWARRAYWSC